MATKSTVTHAVSLDKAQFMSLAILWEIAIRKSR